MALQQPPQLGFGPWIQLGFGPWIQGRRRPMEQVLPYTRSPTCSSMHITVRDIVVLLAELLGLDQQSLANFCMDLVVAVKKSIGDFCSCHPWRAG